MRGEDVRGDEKRKYHTRGVSLRKRERRRIEHTSLRCVCASCQASLHSVGVIDHRNRGSSSSSVSNGGSFSAAPHYTTPHHLLFV